MVFKIISLNSIVIDERCSKDADTEYDSPITELSSPNTEHFPSPTCELQVRPRQSKFRRTSLSAGDGPRLEIENPALSDLLCQIADTTLPYEKNQHVLHKLASQLLSQLHARSFSKEALQLDPPVYALAQLLHLASTLHGCSTTTLQLVLSCLTNACGCEWSGSAVIAGCSREVAMLLISVLRASEGDASLRSCALTVAFHFSSESSVLSVLERGGALAILQALVENLSGNEAEHAHAVIKRLQYAARGSRISRSNRRERSERWRSSASDTPRATS